MVSRQELQTRAGLTPNERELPYSITTSDVEQYLQRKVNLALDRDANDSETKDISVRVYTTEAGKSFLPFVVVLPLEALESGGKKSHKKIPAIFDTKSNDSEARLKQVLYRLFSSYIYTKDDEQAFFSDDWRRSRRVNRETSPVLKSLRIPKVTSVENGNVQIVTFMIDPIRVFHDMLVMPDDQRTFRADITGWQKIQTGEYRYEVTRAIVKGKNGKKYRDTLADELNRKIRGNR